MKKPIYLDYHATTPVAPEVLEAMLPWFTEDFGNPASRSHAFGWRASEAVEIARGQVAELMQADSKEIYFTSGSTEGLNMAIKGLAAASEYRGNHIISIATEHPAVLDSIAWLGKKGCEITLLPVDKEGLLDLDMLKQAIRKETIMVIAMWANNETGVIQPILDIRNICNEKGVPLISDATQAFGKIAIDLREWQVDMLSVSSHKIYGPKGVGAIYINKNLKPRPEPLIHGGGHEGGFRSGTLNVSGIVGFGKAADLRMQQMNASATNIAKLRDHLENTILNALTSVIVNGSRSHRLPTVTNLAVQGVESQAVMSRFRTKLAISSGAACSSADPKPSHVLLAMGLDASEARSSFRFSLGNNTTPEEIEDAAHIFIDAVNEERAISPAWQIMKNESSPS